MIVRNFTFLLLRSEYVLIFFTFKDGVIVSKSKFPNIDNFNMWVQRVYPRFKMECNKLIDCTGDECVVVGELVDDTTKA